MAEILTESFCERCGTRYTFEAAIPKMRRIGKLKVLSKGLKNYVLSDDASLDEALAEARSDEERELSGGQLDAFHQTFQFCMSCRQYTCSNCWNETEGRCLSCAPLSIEGGQLRSPFDDLLAGGGMAPLVSQPTATDGSAASAGNGYGNGHAVVEEPAPPALIGSAWPTIDLFRSPQAEPTIEPLAESGGDNAPEALIQTASEPRPPVADEAWVATHPEVSASAGSPIQDPDAARADFWARPFTGFAPIPEPTNGPDPDALTKAGDSTAEVDLPVSDEAVVGAAADDWQSLLYATPLAEPDGNIAPAPIVEATPDERAAELAERTTRLLGRFRVPARSAGAAPAGQPAEDRGTILKPQVEATPQPIAASPEPRTETVSTPPESPVETVAEPVAVQPSAIETAHEPAPEPTWMVVAPPEVEPEIPAEAVAAVQPVAPIDPAAPPPEPEPVATPTDRIEMPAWPTPVRPPLRDSAPVQAPTVLAPQWPAPLRPGLDASATPFWASGEAGRAAREADLWTASAREVAGALDPLASQGGVQACISCGLSLSATARFCRRCGSRQS
jgi:ribosomal protein L40E